MTGRSALLDIPELHLTIKNHGGSVEHFHHFLLGFLVPLICHARASWLSPRYRAVLIRSCGPMDGIIRQLKSARLMVIDKVEHARQGEGRLRLGQMLRGVAWGSGDRRHMDLRGYDYPVVYNARAFAKAQAGLRDIIGAEIDQARVSLEQKFAPGAPKILVIERGAADPFYLSKAAEAKSAGTARRSIANHQQMVEEVSRRLGPVQNMKLEGMGLAEQIALFSMTDVVIAQHGAALSNLIWAKQGARVIEIMPRTMPKETQDVGFFSNLARCKGLPHAFVWQEHDHADVDPVAVSAAAGGL